MRWRDAATPDRGNLVAARWEPDAAKGRGEARDRYQIAEVVRWNAKEKVRRPCHPVIAVFEDGIELEHDFDHRNGDDG